MCGYGALRVLPYALEGIYRRTRWCSAVCQLCMARSSRSSWQGPLAAWSCIYMCTRCISKQSLHTGIQLCIKQTPPLLRMRSQRSADGSNRHYNKRLFGFQSIYFSPGTRMLRLAQCFEFPRDCVELASFSMGKVDGREYTCACRITKCIHCMTSL